MVGLRDVNPNRNFTKAEVPGILERNGYQHLEMGFCLMEALLMTSWMGKVNSNYDGECKVYGIVKTSF